MRHVRHPKVLFERKMSANMWSPTYRSFGDRHERRGGQSQRDNIRGMKGERGTAERDQQTGRELRPRSDNMQGSPTYTTMSCSAAHHYGNPLLEGTRPKAIGTTRRATQLSAKTSSLNPDSSSCSIIVASQISTSLT